MQGIRFNIIYSISLLSRFLLKLIKEYYCLFKGILRYLRESIKQKIIYSRDSRLLLLFFRLKSICSLRLWYFTHHTTSSFGTSIMVEFVYLLLAYLHATSLLIFYFFFYIAVRLSICLLQIKD